MFQKIMLLLLLATTMTLSFCTTSKKAVSKAADDKTIYSYAGDIVPLIEAYCTPCHFPNGGKVKFLDTHKAVVDNIDNIIYKVELPVGTDGFMPFKSDVALSESQIQLLKDWKNSGMK
jgi:hypothetical protein